MTEKILAIINGILTICQITQNLNKTKLESRKLQLEIKKLKRE